MGKDVIIACDFQNKQETLKFLDQFKEEKPFLKIGMELFYSEGPEIVKELKNRGHKIFLDLKLHDIPNTVEKAMKSLSKLDIDICNVHAAGTIDMMKAAKKGLTKKDGTSPLLIAVTQLTSTSEEKMQKELLIQKPIEEVVLEYAQNTKTAGLDGIVCSPLEVSKIKEKLGKEFLCITPGIRFETSEKGDQVRITTPKKAKELGSDYIVVGRPITQAENPVEAYKKCIKEFCN